DNPNEGSNSTKVTSKGTNMRNTVLRDANVVQQPRPRDSMRNMQSHRQIINQRNKQQVSQMPKRHLGGISEENLQSPRV
ncbi:hypothetical protein NAI50_10780, partial [Francisella tularensis subsp. holarctica]|nr:hypothetical protein [Francisella tularensis subsp. holarctica]